MSSLATVEALRSLAFRAEWLAKNAARIERTRRGRWQPLFYALGWAERSDLVPVAVNALISARVVSAAVLRA